MKIEIEDNESHNKPTILFDTSSIVSIDWDELEEDDMRDLQRNFSHNIVRSASHRSFHW